MARVLTLLLLFSSTAWGQSYSDEMYRRALEDRSTAPLYVLVAFHDEATGSEREVCVLAPFLLGAIHREYGLGYEEAGLRRALEIALTQPGRVFRFTDERARANFPPLYDPEALSAVRRRFESMSDLALREGVFDRRSVLHAIEEHPTFGDAVVHVLLERGILVGRTDITNELYIAE